jgi:hypothetical protein
MNPTAVPVEGAMLNIRSSTLASTLASTLGSIIAGLAVASLLSVAAFAAPAKGGGGGGGSHPRGGGGGGFHGPAFGGGGPRFSTGPRFSAPSRTFSSRIFSSPSYSARSFARPSFRGYRSFAIRHAPSNVGPLHGTAHLVTPNIVHHGIVTAPTGMRTFNAIRNVNAVHNALTARPVRRALHTAGGLHDPATRALVTASVATAAWHHHGGHAWWRHRHGGFGWVGPIFWPFAYYDLYDYAWWGYDYDLAFWDYGYMDIYAGLFDPYGYDDLSGYAVYLPNYAGRGGGLNAYASATPNELAREQASLAQMCGEDSRDIAGLPVDAFQKAIQPNDEQRAALDDLATASAKAAQIIKAACPTDIALTAPRRLAAMQSRIEAMIAAVQTVQPPLEKFYGLLNDEQKAKLTALAQEQHQGQRPARAANEATGATAQAGQACGAAQPGLTDWPSAEIDRTVKPTDEQRKSLDALQSAAASAAEMLKTSCQPATALTPPARLAAVGQRLDSMLQAVKTVRPALDQFYGSLNDEQKANFDAIGPQRMGASGQTADLSEDQAPAPRRHRRHVHHGVNVERMIRRMLSL